MVACVIALGGNVGDSEMLFEAAIAQLAANDIQVLRCSTVRRTKAVGGPSGQPDYLNAAVLAETKRTPRETMQCLPAIERGLGRIRQQRWGPRNIDLDLILHGESIIDQPDLQVPHPRMAFRRFVLEPAAEVAEHLVHPGIGWTLGELSRHARRLPTRIVLWSAAQAPLANTTAHLLRPDLHRVELFAEDFAPGDKGRLHGLLARPAPQLTVLLESKQPPKLRHWADLADRLASMVRGPGRGPWLRLTITAAEDAVAEILAAAQGLVD